MLYSVCFTSLDNHTGVHIAKAHSNSITKRKFHIFFQRCIQKRSKYEIAQMGNCWNCSCLVMQRSPCVQVNCKPPHTKLWTWQAALLLCAQQCHPVHIHTRNQSIYMRTKIGSMYIITPDGHPLKETLPWQILRSIFFKNCCCFYNFEQSFLTC